MPTVFDVFAETPYDFLTVSRGQVYGNRVMATRTLKGVFKLKTGMTKTDGMEIMTSDATLHAHPEDFSGMNPNELVGQGISVNGQDYSIEGISEGKNFDNGIIEHIYMRLQKAEFVRSRDGR